VTSTPLYLEVGSKTAVTLLGFCRRQIMGPGGGTTPGRAAKIHTTMDDRRATSPATEMEDPAPFWKKQGKKGHFFQKNLPNNGKKIMEKIFQIMEKKMEQTMEGTAL